MRGRLIDFAVSRNGKQRVTVEIDQDFTEGFDNLSGADVNLSIKRWRNTRSLDSNAYFHALASQIAECLGQTLEEVKRKLVIDYGVVGTYAMIPKEAEIEIGLTASKEEPTNTPVSAAPATENNNNSSNNSNDSSNNNTDSSTNTGNN